MKRAVGYLRVSPGSQAETKQGVERQRRQVVRYARERGYELVALVEARTAGLAGAEKAANGGDGSLVQLVERARSGEFDAVIVAHPDQLAGDPAAAAALEHDLERHGVEILSAAAEPAARGARSRRRAGHASDDREQRIRLERFRAGKARKKALGRHVHGRAPYGYQSAGGILEPTEVLVPIVRRIFAEAAAGRTPGSIARALNDDAIAAPQGGRAWTEQSLRVILRNRAYTGERYGVERAHAALVSGRTWDAAQAAVRARSRA